jgi:hypothetical protein
MAPVLTNLSDSDDEDETAALMLELAKIKQERAEEKARLVSEHGARRSTSCFDSSKSDSIRTITGSAGSASSSLISGSPSPILLFQPFQSLSYARSLVPLTTTTLLQPARHLFTTSVSPSIR